MAVGPVVVVRRHCARLGVMAVTALLSARSASGQSVELDSVAAMNRSGRWKEASAAVTRVLESSPIELPRELRCDLRVAQSYAEVRLVRVALAEMAMEAAASECAKTTHGAWGRGQIEQLRSELSRAAKPERVASARSTYWDANPTGGVLPSQFIADRPMLAPQTVYGDTVVFAIESAQRYSRIWPGSVSRLHLGARAVLTSKTDGSIPHSVVRLPALIATADIPMLDSGFYMLPVRQLSDTLIAKDGVVGSGMLRGAAWTLDYLRHSVVVTRMTGRQSEAPHQLKLALPVDSTSRNDAPLTAIRVSIDKDSLDLLVDLGASVVLTESAMKELPWEAVVQGTSYVTDSLFQTWRRRHPGWKVIADADRRRPAAMIEVPSVSAAGFVVGPVWFTTVPDEWAPPHTRAFDRAIKGAIGGSLLRFFKVTLDYQNGVMTFAKP